jgi:hypothetical protein
MTWKFNPHYSFVIPLENGQLTNNVKPILMGFVFLYTVYMKIRCELPLLHLPGTMTKPQSSTLMTPIESEYETRTYGMV